MEINRAFAAQINADEKNTPNDYTEQSRKPLCNSSMQVIYTVDGVFEAVAEMICKAATLR
jgi:hypothetical protein